MEKKLNLGGVMLSYVDEEAVTTWCLRRFEQSKIGCAWVSNLNAHAVNLCYSDEAFRDAQKAAELIFCDGRGLALALGVLGCGIPPQVTYNRWLIKLIDALYRKGKTIYFLGDTPSVIVDVKKRIDKIFPGVIVGAHHGFFPVANGWKDMPSNEELQVIKAVNDARPDILVVAMGMPRQEKFIMRNKDLIDAKVILNGGACLKFLSGKDKIAPRFISYLGFEWLYRFGRDPGRLWRRYLIGNPLVLVRLTMSRVMGRLG